MFSLAWVGLGDVLVGIGMSNLGLMGWFWSYSGAATLFSSAFSGFVSAGGSGGGTLLFSSASTGLAMCMGMSG